MSGIKVKLKKFWESLTPWQQYGLINDIITSKEIERGDLIFKSKLIANREKFGNINLTITDNKDILEIISEYYTFPKDPRNLVEMSIPIIKDMIDKETEDNVDVEMTKLKRPGNEDFTEHDFDALDDAFSSLSVSNRDSGGIEMKGIGDRDGNRHDLDALMLALNKGGKTRKKRKRRTRKHLRKKYSAKRMSRKK
jgi:hypothetical protein